MGESAGGALRGILACGDAARPGVPFGYWNSRATRSPCVTGLTPYVHFPGCAREALTFHGDVFGCRVQLHTFAEFNRSDGPPDAIAHGYLLGESVSIFGADVAGDTSPVRCDGMMLSLLGTAPPLVMREWFSQLSQRGRVLDDLQQRPWGAWDGQVVGRYGLHWLLGFEVDDAE